MTESRDVDITESFFKDCRSINPGELYHVRNFDLQDVMTAIELMDPKMDARMQIQRKILYLKETLEKKLLPLDENMSSKLLLGIIDETLACFVNWLKGDTLGQTVFINMYMHCTDQIQNKPLKGFCEAMKNIILFIKDVIFKGSVAEEEDFYLSTSRMPLDDTIPDNKVTGMLKEADDEYTKLIKAASSTEDEDIIKSLQDRIRFTRNFLLWTIVIKKYLQSPTSKPLKDSTYMESSKYLTLLKSHIEKMKETVSLGEPAGQGKHDPAQQSYGLVGFEPYLNQPLLPPAIPRCANIEDRSAAFHFLQETIVRLSHITQILSFDLSVNVINEWDFLQYFGRFGCDGAPQSCVLSRSLLLIFYMSFFAPPLAQQSEHVNNNNNTFLTNSKIDAIKSSIRQFMRLTSWSDLEATMKLDGKLTLFVGACAENLFQIPITHCLNRSRQRNRLELVIDAHWDLYDECVKVDHILRTFINSTNNNTNSKRHKDIPPIFSSFVALFQFRTMVDYIMSGFELDLYAPQELSSVYFILGDNVLRYFLTHYREIEANQQREQAKLPKMSNKKSRKIVDREINANLTSIRDWIARVSVYHELTTAFFYLMCALTNEGRVVRMATSCGQYTTAQMCYEKRFAPIIGRGWFHESGSYTQFAAQLQLVQSRDVSDVYEMAASYFDSSRKLIEKCAPHLFTDTTDVQLKMIAKNNMVVSRVLASGSTKSVSLSFDESKERAFPLIKIK